MHLKNACVKIKKGAYGNSAQCYVSAWMGEGSGGEWIHVYVWLSPFTVRLKLSQHCLLIGYIPIQNKKLKKPPPLETES